MSISSPADVAVSEFCSAMLVPVPVGSGALPATSRVWRAAPGAASESCAKSREAGGVPEVVHFLGLCHGPAHL